jgi:hypothetical protein
MVHSLDTSSVLSLDCMMEVWLVTKMQQQMESMLVHKMEILKVQRLECYLEKMLEKLWGQ